MTGVQTCALPISATVEGVATARAIIELARAKGVDTPIMSAVSEVVRNTISPEEAMITLMKINTGAEI